MRMRWTVGMGVVLIAVAAACSTGTGREDTPVSTDSTAGRPTTTLVVSAPPPDDTTSTRPIDPEPQFVTFADGAFFGRIVRVDFDPKWAIFPADVAVTPGAVSETTVGPAMLHFEDGRELGVPAGTLGGNACVELLRREDWEAITGLESPTLEQVRMYGAPYDCFLYGALRSDGTVAWFDVAEYLAGEPTATLLRRPVGVASGLVLVEGGLGLSVSGDVEVLCSPVDTIEEWVAEVEEVATRTIVEIDVASGQISTLSCYFEF